MKDKYIPNNEYLWEKPNQRYSLFLEKIKNKGLPLNICILGASDGNYVIPAVQKGFNVVAFEVDEVALYGGTVSRGDKEFTTVGLLNHVIENDMQKHVEIVPENYITYINNDSFSSVFTSGSIHYQDNSKYDLSQIISRIQMYVSTDGLLLLEYIHKSIENDDSNRHFVTSSQIALFFNKTDWNITSNKKKTYIEPPNPRNEKIHKVVWGRLHAEKIK